MKKFLGNKCEGITLVALVITIILLLILAGITISQLTQKGLLEKAEQAKEKVQNGEKLQNEILLEYERAINEQGENIVNNNKFTNIDESKTSPQKAIPSGATVIEGDANKGILIKDKKGNEWTWIQVPKTIFVKATGENDYNNIKEDLITYAAYYRSSYIDEWFEGCGISSLEEYNKMYNNMLKSIYLNGGFWISSYEIGDETATKNNITRTEGKDGMPVSKKDQIPYNCVTCIEAQELASTMTTDTNKTSSLLFGIQWDLVCKYLEGKQGLSEADIKNNSTNWGNYSNKQLTITSKNAKQIPSPANATWSEITGIKPATFILLTTGASEETNKMNIYDLAGNLYELTLEKGYITRGGGYSDGNPTIYPVSYRYELGSVIGNIPKTNVGFRSTIYDKFLE